MPDLLPCVAEQSLVDHHCHGVLRRDVDEATLESMLTEGAGWPGGSVFDSQAGLAFRRICPPVLGLPPVKPGPVPGYVLIADRNNNRILLVSPGKRIVWEFPRPGDIRPGQSFHDPDDAFFTPGYTGISINEEFNQTISLIHLRSHRIVWSYGHAGIAGSGAGLALLWHIPRITGWRGSSFRKPTTTSSLISGRK